MKRNVLHQQSSIRRVRKQVDGEFLRTVEQRCIMGGYFKGNPGKREKPGEYYEEYLAQFIPACLQFCTQKDPVHRITQLQCAHGEISLLRLYWDPWQGRGRSVLKTGQEFGAAQKYLFKILKNVCCIGGMAQWGRGLWLYFQTPNYGRGYVPLEEL